jgi:hypothetical protein
VDTTLHILVKNCHYSKDHICSNCRFDCNTYDGGNKFLYDNGTLLPNYTASHVKTGIKYSIMCGQPFRQVHEILQCNLREAPDKEICDSVQILPSTHKQHLMMTLWASLNLVLGFGDTKKELCMEWCESTAAEFWYNGIFFHSFTHSESSNSVCASCGDHVRLQHSCMCLIHKNDSLQWTQTAFWNKSVRNNKRSTWWPTCVSVPILRTNL